MSSKNLLVQQFLQTVENQLRDDDPPETRLTFARLQEEGYSERNAKLLIAQCVAAEIIAVMQGNETFNQERYVQCLNKLPEAPR